MMLREFRITGLPASVLSGLGGTRGKALTAPSRYEKSLPVGVGLTYSETKSVQQVVAVSVPRLARERGYFKVQKLGASQGLSPALEEPQLGWEQIEPGYREVCLLRGLLIKQSLLRHSPPRSGSQ